MREWGAQYTCGCIFRTDGPTRPGDACPSHGGPVTRAGYIVERRDDPDAVRAAILKVGERAQAVMRFVPDDMKDLADDLKVAMASLETHWNDLLPHLRVHVLAPQVGDPATGPSATDRDEGDGSPRVDGNTIEPMEQ